METLTGQNVWLVKVQLGQTWGVIGVFDNVFAAEKLAEEKYRKWTGDEKFIWSRRKTAQEVHIEASTQLQPLDGKLMIAEYPVRSNY